MEAEADQIFRDAGAFKAACPDLWEQTRDILAGQMARLSLWGLTYDRVAVFEEQKQALVEDLKALCACVNAHDTIVCPIHGRD